MPIGPILRDDNSFASNPVLQQPRPHAGSESDNRVRSASRKIQHSRCPRRNGNVQGNGNVWINIHLPSHVTAAAYPLY
jgi:hypothetical protein